MLDRLWYAARVVYFFAVSRWRFSHLSGERLRRFQDWHARRRILHAMRYSPFHAERFRGLDLAAWRSFPVIEKREMMRNFEQYTTVGVPVETVMEVALRAEKTREFSEKVAGYTTGLSSGTSGFRGLFLVGEEEQVRWAGTILSYAVPGLRRSGWKVAMLTRSNSNLYQTLGSSWLELKYIDMMTPVNELVRGLNQLRPDLLVGAASLLTVLAEEKDAGRLRIAPARVISVAEVLEPQDKGALERAFRVPVHQIYQCTEGLIAACCERGSLHVLEDVMVLDLEVLFEDDEIVRGVAVITDLWRSTQPILRYRLNDVLVIEKRGCLCGSSFRVLRAIEGRCDDVLYALDTSGALRPVFADLVRRVMLLSSDSVAEYRVVQRTVDAWLVYVELFRGACVDDVRSSLETQCAKVFAANGLVPPVLGVVEGIPPGVAGAKRRRVQRLFALEPEMSSSPQRS